MATKWQGIRNKSFTLPGEGGDLIVSETIDRLAIEITVRLGSSSRSSVRLSAEQFEALCGMSSVYDGLEVRKREPQLVESDADAAEGPL